MGKWKWMDDIEVHYWIEDNGCTRRRRSQRSDGRKTGSRFRPPGGVIMVYGFGPYGSETFWRLHVAKSSNHENYWSGLPPVALKRNGQWGAERLPQPLIWAEWRIFVEKYALVIGAWLQLFCHFRQYDKSVIYHLFYKVIKLYYNN